MGFFNRIEDIIKSYFTDEDDRVFGRSSGGAWQSSRDPDLDAAFDELNDFLSGGSGRQRTAFGPGEDAGYEKAESFGPAPRSGVPAALRQDFAELGLGPEASAEECKAAYKQLLKKHHPDRHAGHPGNLKKATEKSTRLNAAYDRIERWRRTGKVE
jgi:DnaJ-domain-containing protein 1